MKLESSILILALSLPSASAFTFSPTTFHVPSLSKDSNSHNANNLHPLTSTRTTTRLFMGLDNHNNNDKGSNNYYVGQNDNEVDTTTTSSNTVDVSKLLAEAKALKERAEKERLEAERMTTLLILDKISNLEKQLAKVQASDKDDDKTIKKKTAQIQEQISSFRKQMEVQDDKDGNAEKAKIIDAIGSPLVSSKRLDTDADALDAGVTPAPIVYPERNMPQTLFEKRLESYKTFSPEVKQLFATAVQVADVEDGETIIRKCYNIEMKRKGDGNIAPLDILDIANGQAGFETLPPPIQDMVIESVGMKPSKNLNNTEVVELLVEQKKVKRTGDGGVEFSMEDSYEDDDRNARDREFTNEEIKGAVELYENLPLPMKTILTKSVGETLNSNSTDIVNKMIEQGKLLPAEDGVEFVVFGDAEDESPAEREASNYVRNLLPEVTRKEGQEPSEEVAMAFFSDVLGKKTFNPSSKPEKIPGGFVIRGDNTFKTGDELVKALDAQLKKSSVAGKLNYYYMKDPTIVTKEQFDEADFENPVLVITGPDITPDTNRFVKPVVTALSGISIASFAVATCLSTDLQMDVGLVETMTAPLIFSILGTQIAHEAVHQIVALKDKFKAGPPTLVPSLNLGLQGCITPIKTSPPNSNSLFDFAISGPLVGMIISVCLLYSGLEKQVFMDAAAQANLPSLPVNLVRSSSLAGGMVEWLLGDGTLVSGDADPSALIRLHPFAIAGFVGIVSNALNLLPVGNTDGGRVAQALYGRGFAKFIRNLTLVSMVLAGFFGGDEVNLLLFFAIFAQIWQKEPEVPCKNEIDGVSDERAILAFLTAFLVGLAVVPMSLG